MVFIEIKSKLVLCMPGRQMEDGLLLHALLAVSALCGEKRSSLFFLQGKQIVLVAVKHNNIIIKVLFISNIDVEEATQKDAVRF
jgi:hypothetical protein